MLRTGAPQFLDLERNAGATFFLQADKPALYEIRSTGLLATSGTLRTRTVPELRREEENGVGRNFLLQQYLREGDYQATVSTIGQSRGHLGVEIAATPLDDAGELRPEFPARWTLPAGHAALWRFTIPRDGVYGLRGRGAPDDLPRPGRGCGRLADRAAEPGAGLLPRSTGPAPTGSSSCRSRWTPRR